MEKFVIEVINEAFFKAQIYGQDYETLDPCELKKGLTNLQYVIAEKNSDDSTNPYYQTIEFSIAAGTPSIFIDNLIGVSTITFLLNSTLRYPVTMKSRKEFEGSFRAENIQTIPYTGFMERGVGGATIYFYPFPQQAYTFKLVGKFGLEQVTDYYTDMLLAYDLFYVEYLVFLLAARLRTDYGYEELASITKEIQKKEQIMANAIGPPDATCYVKSSVCKAGANPYVAANFLTSGFYPSG